MNRRSTQMRGWVNFPIFNPDYENSNEGGMFVRLMVFDNPKEKKQFPLCTGNYIFEEFQEVLVGDDKHPMPKDEDFIINGVFDVDTHHEAMEEWRDWYKQQNCLASILIGTTGWSGWHTKKKEYFTCDCSYLTVEALRFYPIFYQLYPNCEIHLLTFLDT